MDEIAGQDMSAISMAGQDKSALLISGFIRKMSDNFDIEVPLELVGLLEMYFVTETIHLITENAEHYLVELSDILKDRSTELVLCG